MALKFVSRVMMAGIFVAGGFSKIPAFDALAPVVGSKIAATGFYTPTAEVAKLCLAIAIFLEAAGGLLFALGFEKWGAGLIIAFLAAVTPIMHNISGLTGEARQNEIIAIMKNVALGGAFLYVLASKGGKAAGKAKTH